MVAIYESISKVNSKLINPNVNVKILVKRKLSIMSELNIEILKEIVEKLPDDFLVEFKDNEGSTFTLSDNINVKVSEKKLVLKKY